jgi:formate hydrogenlyase subunit 3/multisubunit Na+/H+ antiporter MnhD subunit
MKKFRVGLIIVAIIIVIVNLTFIDYSNLNWSENSGPYLGIMAMICVIFAGLVSYRYDKSKK